MDYKKTNAASSTITRNTQELEAGTENIYESLAVISRRSNQIASEMREELTAKLAEFASNTDNLEEIFENREQIEISRFYERLPKPTAIAVQEFLEDRTYHRNPTKDAAEQLKADELARKEGK